MADEPPKTPEQPGPTESAPSAAPLDDVVAGLIDEKPSRPKLSVVPPLAEAVAQAKAQPADDPLSAVLDGPPPTDEPLPVNDAFEQPKTTPEMPDLGKLLDLNVLSSGLRHIADWIDKQVPQLNNAVGKFLSQVEHTFTIGVNQASGAGAASGGAGASGPKPVVDVDAVVAEAAPAEATAPAAAPTEAAAVEAAAVEAAEAAPAPADAAPAEAEAAIDRDPPATD